jgi:anti-anti-sigma factor
MISVSCDKSGDVAVVKCAGRMVRGEAVETLKRTVVAQAGARIVAIDMSDVEALDGGGLGMLVFLHRWAGDNGTQLKLVNPSHHVHEMLERTGLDRVIDVSSLRDALTVLGGRADHHSWKADRELRCALGC